MTFCVVSNLLAAGLLTLAFCGCETTAKKSAELEKSAKHEKLALQGVSVTKESPNIEVLQSIVLRSSEATAVVVVLRNDSRHAIEDSPIEITVRDAKGSTLFQNNQPGEDPSLTQVSIIAPGEETVWVDDQVQIPAGSPSPEPASAVALVGEGRAVSGSAPQMSVSGTHLTGEGGEAGAAGTAVNRSPVAQQNLVVYALARKSGRIVAAGRAVLPEVAPGAQVPFQVYFVGDPAGAKIEPSAPPTTF